PEETDEEFNQTYEFLKEIELYETHVFKYSPREGTKAAQMKDQVDPAEKNRRSDILLELNKVNKRNFEQKHIGKTVGVLVETIENGFAVGHTQNYIKVGIKAESGIINDIVAVEITDISEHFVLAQRKNLINI
ncbi:MAG: TRAM domain-containing protein, partial [Proteocatella sp.]